MFLKLTLPMSKVGSLKELVLQFQILIRISDFEHLEFIHELVIPLVKNDLSRRWPSQFQIPIKFIS